MKKALSALALLTALLGFCIWNASAMASDALRWQEALHQADALIQAEHWQEAQELLESSYQDWTAQQNHLRVVSTHSILDEAECLYCRVIALVSIQDQSELLVDLSALTKQLELLSLREQLSFENIL